jgi:hypothetical protein
LLATLLGVAPALADYKDSYSRGLEAVKDGDWAEVRRRMQEAIADRADAAPRVRLYGQRWEPYVPQYYLGLAAFRQGDCATALQQWKSPANQAVIGSVPALNAEQGKHQASCEQKLAQNTDKPPTTPDKPPTTPTTIPVVPGDTPPDKPPTTKPEVKPEVKPPVEKPPVEKPPVDKPPVEKPPVKPPTPTTTIVERVPPPLLEAYKAYLAGRYADVNRINPESYADPRPRAQAFLVRAAARFTQAAVEADEKLLDGARADVRALRQADAQLQPDPTLFSPRFREFVTQVR